MTCMMVMMLGMFSKHLASDKHCKACLAKPTATCRCAKKFHFVFSSYALVSLEDTAAEVVMRKALGLSWSGLSLASELALWWVCISKSWCGCCVGETTVAQPARSDQNSIPTTQQIPRMQSFLSQRNPVMSFELPRHRDLDDPASCLRKPNQARIPARRVTHVYEMEKIYIRDFKHNWYVHAVCRPASAGGHHESWPTSEMDLLPMSYRASDEPDDH